MSITRAAVVVLLGLASVPASARVQQPPGAAPPTVSADGVVSGALTVADTGQPARNATVRLVSLDRRTELTAISDGDGRFEIIDVPAGQYTLSAAKAGLLDTVYGARKPGADSPGATVDVGPGQRIQKLSIT